MKPLTEEEAKRFWDKIEKQVDQIKIDRANFHHMLATGKINGSLLNDITKLVYGLNYEVEQLKKENENLRSVMVAAAEEIKAHWQSHCDNEGYGPTNLVHRLENGIAANYPGYKFGAFTELQSKLSQLEKERELVIQILEVVSERWSEDYAGSTVGILGRNAKELLERFK